jgi:two-component system CheB/CheR fusion protein
MAEPEAAGQLVVVGASAGGIEALSTLVSTLPTPFPGPLVIAQHLDPHRHSHLAEILGRRTSIPVRTVSSQEPLRSGVIYVVPPNRHVEINDHAISLVTEEGNERPKPSVDMLLSSASTAFGENLIAVILTGSGSDGSAGARQVKKAGGTVVIQDPQTATFPSMPASLPQSSVDIVAELDRIGPLLHDLLTGKPVLPRPDQDRDLQLLLAEVQDQNGIDFKRYKPATIQRRLHRRLLATGVPSLKEYRRYLQEHPEEHQRLISSFLIKVTEFMRNPELFDLLARQLIPELAARARKEGRELRLWSAGCATGEEAYSLAIQVCETLGGKLDEVGVRIFATDLDAAAIAFARQGIYPASAVEDLSPATLEKYFNEAQGSYQVKKRVRSLTVFGEHDLGQRAPFPRIDLVMSRNVLIYFTPELQRHTLQLFAFSLQEGGYLVLGKAETTSPAGSLFAPYHPGLKVFRRVGQPVVIPSRHLSAPPFRVRSPRSAQPNTESPAAAPDLPRPRGAGEQLLQNLPLGVVLVNQRYEILDINAAARRLLFIHLPALGEDFGHLTHVLPPKKLRAAIAAAFRGGTGPVLEQLTVEPPLSEKPRQLQLSFQHQKLPLGIQPGGTAETEAVLILIQDVTELAAALEGRQGAEAELGRLAEANPELMRANEKLALSNEELRSANQEYLLTWEEKRSTTEEVETLKEEFQAANEELETLNEELQATIEELNTTNADLEARSQELKEVAGSAEAERSRLSTILASIGDGVMIVDGAGHIRETNQSFNAMFPQGNFLPYDQYDQPFAPHELPQARAAQGETFRLEFTLPGRHGEVRRYFEASGQPLKGSGGQELQGGVVVIRDITERSIQQLQDRFLAMAGHELRTPLVPLQGYLDLLVRLLPEKGGDERLREYAGIAQSQVKRLTGLINDLVDTARIRSGKFTLKMDKLDLALLVDRCRQLAKAMVHGQTIQTAVEEPPVLVRGDVVRLEQVLMNLMINAIKYAPGADRIDLELRREQGQAVLRVRDYGKGIPTEELPKLFSSFYQVSKSERPSQGGGLGLGLYIAKEIVTAHGGRITVSSVPGEGSTFSVVLPLLPPP